MTEFLTAILSFPTVVFTLMLIIIVFYWLMVIVGAIGVDVLHIGEAAGGKIEGMLGGAVEGKIEGVIGGAVEGKIEGVVGGAVEGKIEGVADAAAGKAEGAAGHIGGGGGFLAMLGFGKVPATAVISSLVLWSWALCLVFVQAARDLGLGVWLVDTLPPLVAVFLSGVLTGLIVRALGRFLVKHEPLRRSDLVGKLCTITTGRVDSSFGQAIVEEGGTDLTIDVRCDPPNVLVRRSRAVVVAYDAEHNTFTVEAYEQGLVVTERQPPA
jgi:hypothetical protein